MKNKIIIHGSQYKDNFGDTLLVKVLQDELIEFDLYSSTASDKVLKSLGIKKAKKLYLLTSKYFIYGGGGYFGQPNKNITRWSIRFIIRHCIVGVLRRLFNRKYAFFGTGFGPLTHPFASFLAKFILKGADVINFRDKESVSFAKNINSNLVINETADLVPGYISKVKKADSNKTIVLHMHIPVGDECKLTKIIDEYIEFKNVYFKDHKIVIISDSEDDIQQTWFFNIVKNKYKKIEIKPYDDFEKTISLLSQSDFVLTNKLHVAIVSASMNIMVSSIYMHSKTKRFFEQINRPESAMPLEDITPDVDLNSFFKNTYENGIDNDALNHVIESSLVNIKSLREWCKND